MRRILLLTISLVFLSSQNSYASNNGRHLTIFTEPNLALALTKLARIYSQKSRTIISVNFNSDDELISEIDYGEPADVFISAHPKWIKSLRQKGLVDVYNISYIARDKLVLVTSKKSLAKSQKLSLRQALRKLDLKRSTLIIDNEGDSSGYFAKKLLSPLKLKDIKLFSKLNEDRTTLINSIRKNTDYDYALLLGSQINGEPNLQIVAQGSGEHIFYQALVIAGNNMEVAREFLKFLKSDEAKKILRENGFLTD